MTSEAEKRPLQIVYQDGQPFAVILDMRDYIEMLERLEDLEDLERLNEMRRKPPEFGSIDKFMEEHAQAARDDTLSFASRWRGKFKAAERGDARYDALAKKYLNDANRQRCA